MESIESYLKKIYSLNESNSYIKWIIESSSSFKKEEILSSREVSKKFIHLLPSIRVKECFRNALLCAMTNDNVLYFEGYYLFKDLDFPIEHAFNVVNGKVNDLTAVKLKMKPISYFGIQVPKSVLVKYLETDQILTPLQFYFRTTKK